LHIVVDISGHGYGHAGMTVPLIARLHELSAGVRITVRSSLPAQALRERIDVSFNLAPPPYDPALAMFSPFDVDVATTARDYQELYARWDEVLALETTQLQALRADLVLANIPFMSLAAAQKCGIPAIALSPLNWADIYKALCGHEPNAAEIHRRLLESYRSARVYLQPTPTMPMDDLDNRQRIGPLARVVAPRRAALEALAGGASERFVVISFGGIPGRPAFALPQLSGVRWFVPDNYAIARADITRHADSGLPFIELLASADAVVTKPGYGMFTEAACNGVRVAYLPRADWPEAPYLVDWLYTVSVACEVNEQMFMEGAIGPQILELLARPAPARVAASGVDDALAAIKAVVGG
jgi:hypothetical protein